MTSSRNTIFALSALILVIQVTGEEPKPHHVDVMDKYDQVDASFVPIPVKLHRARREALAEDDCHKFHNNDLPTAKTQISAAWERSMTAVQNVTQAFSDMKGCLSWNVFKVLPCAIHSTMELIYSYRTYKPELAQFVHDVRSAAGNATTTFIGCAKILIIHQAK